jgi:hypothetical protein
MRAAVQICLRRTLPNGALLTEYRKAAKDLQDVNFVLEKYNRHFMQFPAIEY